MTRLPIPPDRPLVLFTDLDGTLIDHHSYSADAARDALDMLDRRGVPVVFCSSKTFAEQLYLQQQLDLSHPFILENGSAVAVPKGYFPIMPQDTDQYFSSENGAEHHDLYVFAHADAQALRSELAQYQDIKGFSIASDAELSAATGLAGEALQRARDRWFTETLLAWPEAGQIEVLKQKLAEKGWALSRGGRFFTVQSAQVNKGNAVQWLKNVFRQNMPGAPISAAAGDSPNDAPMLAAVDIPFLVQKHNGTWADVEVPDLIKIEKIGPEGFSSAVKMLLG